MGIFKQKVKASQVSDQPPAGNHGAVLVAIVDLGTHQEEYKGVATTQRKVYFVWELTSEKSTSIPGQNMLQAKMFTLSFGKKAKLRALIEGWRGKALEDGEEFDLAKLLGKQCMVNVVHNAAGYAEVAAVSAPPKGIKVEKPLRTPFLWEMEGDKPVDLSWLPWIYGQKVEEYLAESEEANGRSEPISKTEPSVTPETEPEEIPF